MPDVEQQNWLGRFFDTYIGNQLRNDIRDFRGQRSPEGEIRAEPPLRRGGGIGRAGKPPLGNLSHTTIGF